MSAFIWQEWATACTMASLSPDSASGPFCSSQVEEFRVAQGAVFGDLGIAGQKFAPGQGGEQGGVGDHQARLVKHADQILALAAC